mmetsp:Transcript_35203/g.85703  ORF Transcript_35203/g.85703 Transcript_35203/m.85703 type:complete len:242 (-) Transcript_35203:635-1360(-)
MALGRTGRSCRRGALGAKGRLKMVIGRQDTPAAGAKRAGLTNLLAKFPCFVAILRTLAPFGHPFFIAILGRIAPQRPEHGPFRSDNVPPNVEPYQAPENVLLRNDRGEIGHAQQEMVARIPHIGEVSVCNRAPAGLTPVHALTQPVEVQHAHGLPTLRHVCLHQRRAWLGNVPPVLKARNVVPQGVKGRIRSVERCPPTTVQAEQPAPAPAGNSILQCPNGIGGACDNTAEKVARLPAASR